jgi:glycosyltransferase involved in cell wall biosynthesis
MHSTLRNIVAAPPPLKEGAVVGRLLTCAPAGAGERQHGGLRLLGKYKRRAAGGGAPLVTVITVCRNAAATIEQCMGSVFRQTHSNVEYIVVDGASSDGTLDCIRRHGHAIDYWMSEPDAGLYQAMNKGLALASGDYVMVLNADDWYAEDCIETLIKARKYSGATFVCALAQAVDGDGEPLLVMRSMPFNESVRIRMPLRHETMLLPASVYDDVGRYSEKYRVNSDFELAIRLYDAGCTAYEVPRALLFFRNTGLSNSGSPALIEERIAIISGQFPFLGEREARVLADRDLHAIQQLLEIARRYPDEEKLVNALRLYSEDNVTRSARPQWAYFRESSISWPAARPAKSGPEISIILPFYNGRDTLPACLDSVLQQSFRDFELICVDDLGPDDSRSVVESYRSRDPRIVVVENERNIGHGASRNRGIRHARGRYVFHIDPDDTIPPDALKLLHARAVKHGSDLVKGAYLREQFHHHTAMRRPEIRNVASNTRTFTHASVAEVPGIYTTLEGHWSYLYRIELARRVPYPEDLKMGQDAIFMVCVLVQARTMTVIKDVVYRYHWNPASAMNAFSFRKYLDVLEWRRRAWHMLDDAGLRKHGDELMQGYLKLLWHELYFRHYAASPDQAQLALLADAVREAFRETGLSPAGAPDRISRFFACLVNGWIDQAAELIGATPAEERRAAEAAQPLVSVILPVFNASRTLAECIDSVLAQTLADFELICVNDCSTDDSQSIIERYCAADPRIVSISNETNLGHGGSRNRGIQSARGRYIFHVDPDDTLPPGALQSLHSAAARHGSDLVKGAYLREQALFGGAAAAGTATLSRGPDPIVNTTLARTPGLLRNTEGHWSFLYDADLARRVPYPTDLKMGPDSLFMASVLPAARRITVIDDVVYHYRANAESAMNTFNFRKYQDALEWRKRAWHVLRAAGFQAIGDRLLQSYWGAAFFPNLAAALTTAQLEEFLEAFRAVFAETGIAPTGPASSPFLRALFPLILEGRDIEARELMLAWGGARAAGLPSLEPGARKRLKVATLSSWDHGGAGTGSRRRVAALRRHGIDATIYSLVVRTGHDYVKQIESDVTGSRAPAAAPRDAAWAEVRKRAIDPARAVPGYRASEMFSLSDSVVDFRKLRGLFDEHDVVHLHWVVGMLDCQNAGEVLGRKPVVWTLADMNPFTGGCHYSEGCEEYKRECRRCPLLGGESDLAHRTWKIKKQAYEKLENLHIVCPSPWMAQRARESSLLGDRPIHYIPNAMPVDALGLHAKTVARVRLGLPLDKKLLLFGADSLASVRKGSNVLRDTLRAYCARGGADGVELMVFGSGSIDVPLPVHRLGYVSNESRLALLYAAADAYLLPSLEDNAPLTVGESLLCGTPVIAFPVGNVEALVEHRVTGYVAAHLDEEDFATGIEWALAASPEAALERSARCRMAAGRYHDPRLAAERHEALYRAAIDAAT